MAEISLERLGKVYPDGTRALRDLDIAVDDGELLVLVGPSGCGKTTALRMVAGLETITEGDVRIGDRRVNNVPPRDRDIAMVFQSYALYPHLSVRENIGFGLTLRKVPKDERRQRVERAASTLGLSDYLDRKPRNLSGGQRQRVAMGRAIVRQPAAFLMDEPLSNLDAKLRVQMRAEIGRLQRELRVTTLYVTHDQVEAMTLGHRVAVLRDGLLQQIAPPQELYDRPSNLFVAGFIGSPAMNFLPAELRDDRGRWTLVVGDDTLSVPPDVLDAHAPLRRFAGRQVIIGLRPEDLEDASVEGRGDRDTIGGMAELVEPLGSDLMVYLSLALPMADLPDDATRGTGGEGDEESAPDPLGDTSSLVARFDPMSKVALGDRVRVAVNTARMHFFDPETGTSINDA